MIRHQLEPVKLSEIYISCRSKSTVVFSSEMTLDWVWGGPNTMRDLPTLSPGVGGTLQEVQEVLRHTKNQSNCPEFILAIV